MEKDFVSEYLRRLERAMQAQGRPEEAVRQCLRYARQLLDRDLPVLFDGRHVRQVLQVEAGQRWDYHVFHLIQKGKMREITAPSRKLKRKQRWILEHILQKQEVSPYAHGFVAGRSIKTNALLHASHDYVLCMDIADFFPSIPQSAAFRVFAMAGYAPRAADALAEICCHDDVLPQGAPTSPCLANLVFSQTDAQLAGLAERYGAVYSRYADDLTFSSDGPLHGLAEAAESILLESGFCVNGQKTKYFLPGQPKRITGLVVQNGLVRVPRQLKRCLKQEIHYCRRFGVLVHLENSRAAHCIHYREYLYGKAYYIKMIEPEVGERFLQELDEVRWPACFL